MLSFIKWYLKKYGTRDLRLKLCMSVKYGVRLMPIGTVVPVVTVHVDIVRWDSDVMTDH